MINFFVCLSNWLVFSLPMTWELSKSKKWELFFFTLKISKQRKGGFFIKKRFIFFKHSLRWGRKLQGGNLRFRWNEEKRGGRESPQRSSPLSLVVILHCICLFGFSTKKKKKTWREKPFSNLSHMSGLESTRVEPSGTEVSREWTARRKKLD